MCVCVASPPRSPLTVYCVPGCYLIPPAAFAPNRLFLFSKKTPRPLSRLSVGRHYQIPLWIPSCSLRPFSPLCFQAFSPFLSDLHNATLQTHSPLPPTSSSSSASPPCGLTVAPLVHYRGCASELTQSGFSSGQARELRENQLVLCVTLFFFLLTSSSFSQ